MTTNRVFATAMSAVAAGTLALSACAPTQNNHVLTDAPAWELGDQWTLGVSHQRLMGKTSDDPVYSWTAEKLFDFTVEAEGFVDGVDAFRVNVTRAGDSDEYLTLYFRQADLGLIRIEEVPTNKRGGAKRVTRNLFGEGGAFPHVTNNVLLPHSFPAFGQQSGVFKMATVVDGVGAFHGIVGQQFIEKDAGSRVVVLQRDGIRVEQTWRAGEPWWSEQVTDSRSIARLVTFKGGSAIGAGPMFDIDTAAEGAADPAAAPLQGEARYQPWNGVVFDESGEADGVFSGHWWPMLDGPGKSLLYSDNGPMQKYDEYMMAATGSNPGAKAWEHDNHRTTESNTGWWGHCNGWAASSVLEDEPRVPGTGEGVSFTVGDKKGLLAEIHNGAGLDLWVGSRHNGKRDGDNTVDDPDTASFKDVKPYDLHNTLIQYIGLQQEALIMDVNPGYQVWNYPAFKYEIVPSPHSDDDKMNYTAYVTFVSFSSPSYVGVRTHTETYRYWLTVDANGEPVQGASAYTGSSVNDHPDFIWHPEGTGTQNPVKYNRIREIVELGAGQQPGDDHPDRAEDTDADDTLVIDSSLDGDIEIAGDVDYFRFDAEAGYSYAVETFGLGAGSDTFLYLLGTDGTTEIDSDDDGGVDRASRIEWDGHIVDPTFPSSYTHFVRVRHYAPSGTGSYKIRITREEHTGGGGDDRPNSIGDVSDNDILGNAPMAATIESAGDVDFFGFEAEAGKTYELETGNLVGGMDSVIEVFGVNGEAIGTDDDGGQGYASRFSFAAAMSGRHFVMVRHYGTGTGGYTIGVSVSGGGGGIDAVDISNSIGEGNIETGGESDLYKFEAEANRLYVIDTYELAGGMDTYMHLLGTDGSTELARNDDGGTENLASHIEFTPTVSGTYYVRIRHYSASGTGTYKISVIHALN